MYYLVSFIKGKRILWLRADGSTTTNMQDAGHFDPSDRVLENITLNIKLPGLINWDYLTIHRKKEKRGARCKAK